MNITAYFSQIGVPKTGLSPTINIRDISDGSLTVSAAAMTEVGDGFYWYNFSGYNATKDYSIRCDGGAILFDSDRYAIASTGFPSDGSGFTALGDTRVANLDATISSRATEAKQDIIDTNIDQIETAVITNAAGVDIAADIIAVKAETVLIVADTNELQADDIPGTLATIDALVDRILDATEIRRAAVADAGATTTKFITNLTETTNDFWNRMAILFTSGQNDGQMRRIKDYVGGTKEVTIQTPLSFAPADADTFIICTVRAFVTPDIEDIADQIWDETQASHVAAGSFGEIATEIAAIPTTAMRGTDNAALASILKEVNQSLNGTKVVIDRAASTFKVYDTDGTTLLFTITKSTVGNTDTLTRT